MSIQYLLPDLILDGEIASTEQRSGTSDCTQVSSYRGKRKASDKNYSRSRIAQLRSTWASIWAHFNLLLRSDGNCDVEPNGGDDRKRAISDYMKESNGNSNAPGTTGRGASNAEIEMAQFVPALLDRPLNSLLESHKPQFQHQSQVQSQTEGESKLGSDLSQTPPFRHLWPDRSEIEYLRRANALELREHLSVRRIQLLFLRRESWTQEIRSKSDGFEQIAQGSGRRRSVPLDMETTMEVEADMDKGMEMWMSRRRSKGRGPYIGRSRKEGSVGIEAWWKTAALGDGLRSRFGEEDVIVEEEEEKDEGNEKGNNQKKNKGKERAMAAYASPGPIDGHVHGRGWETTEGEAQLSISPCSSVNGIVQERVANPQAQAPVSAPAPAERFV